MSTQDREPAEFSAPIRELVARRAAYRCSMPRCGRSTVGPAGSGQRTVSVGVAAHIYSAAPGGPRGTGGLTAEERASSDNAIWLCALHAALIDKNQGADYPAGTLISYKALHESRIARELQGGSTHFGWIDSLHVHTSPLFEGSPRIELGKLTLLIGDNGVGKTAICEWLAAATDTKYLERWRHLKPERQPLDIEIRYLDPEESSVRLALQDDCTLLYRANGRLTSIPTAPLKIIFPKFLSHNAVQRSTDDLSLLSDALGLHPYQILGLFSRISAGEGTNGLSRLALEPAEHSQRLLVDIEGAYKKNLPLAALSDSERDRLIMAICELAAKDLAIRYPTLLFLDSVSRFDSTWLKRHGERLSSPETPFQTVASLVRRNIKLDELRWAGWKVLELDDEPPTVRVRSLARA